MVGGTVLATVMCSYDDVHHGLNLLMLRRSSFFKGLNRHGDVVEDWFREKYFLFRRVLYEKERPEFECRGLSERDRDWQALASFAFWRLQRGAFDTGLLLFIKTSTPTFFLHD